MIIDGVFKTIPEQVEEYQNLLKERIHKDINGGILMESELKYGLEDHAKRYYTFCN